MSWRPHTLVLPLPDGGGVVYILGTAHVSPVAAAQAAELVRDLRPQAVVVELDSERFVALQRSVGTTPAQSAARLVERGDTVAKLLRIALRGEVVAFVGALGFAVAGVCLDTTPGGEFSSALAAAREVGSLIVLGDRPATVTMARLPAASSPVPSA